MLIMIILLAGVFFCYSLVRLWMLIARGDPPEVPRAIDPRGYAIPRKPIRVVLAQDEEAAGVESEAMRMKPPAYGLWRESVVGLKNLDYIHHVYELTSNLASGPESLFLATK